MNTNPNPKLSTPHLTPESLVGQRFSRDTFEGINTALVGSPSYFPRSRSAAHRVLALI
jgi:hypothetical protein